MIVAIQQQDTFYIAINLALISAQWHVDISVEAEDQLDNFC